MRFVVSEISFRRSLYGSVFIEITLTPVKHEIDSKIYASCDIDPVDTGKILFTRVTDFSMSSLLQIIEDKEREIAEMEELLQDYSEEYVSLCKEVEMYRKSFAKPLIIDAKYQKITNMVENIAKASSCYGSIVDI